MTLTLTDLFCGAGGSSTGAAQIPGITVRVASNHWARAIETHETNHPDTGHVCADLSQIDPRYYPTTDILWASPECTNHSGARGKKRDTGQIDMFNPAPDDAAAERSRATMWDVVRFTEAHHYKAIIVENVVEAANWAPFQAWLAAMDSLGYKHHTVFLNSMHAHLCGDGAPQSRDRIYIVFWKKGNKTPDFERLSRPRATCPNCGDVNALQIFKRSDRRWGRYRAQYYFQCPHRSCREILEPHALPAASALDFTLRGQRIGDRSKPLSAKTLARIQAGIDRYWAPFVAEVAGNTYDAADPRHPGHGTDTGYMRAWPTAEPFRTIHTTASKALIVPDEKAMRTITTRAETGLAIPCGGTWRTDAAPLSEPWSTRTTRDTDAVAFPPFIAELRGGGSTARSTTDPLATVTASGNHHGLCVPPLLMRNNTARGNQAQMSTPITEPARTITTTGHQSMLAPGASIDINDVEFRMITPDECKRAQAFPAAYIITGTNREQVRQSGNAVTPPAARDLIAIVAASLGHEVFALAA